MKTTHNNYKCWIIERKYVNHKKKRFKKNKFLGTSILVSLVWIQLCLHNLQKQTIHFIITKNKCISKSVVNTKKSNKNMAIISIMNQWISVWHSSVVWKNSTATWAFLKQVKETHKRRSEFNRNSKLPKIPITLSAKSPLSSLAMMWQSMLFKSWFLVAP